MSNIVYDLKLELKEKVSRYIKSEETINYIMDVCDFAILHHEGQFRKSKEPYIVHPINVALILCDLTVGPYTLAAGLLHDLIEDTDVTFEDIEENFGYEAASLVEGVTKIGMMKFSTRSEAEVENQKKLIIGMIKDVRVIIIKLADRLHNMRTLNNLSIEKQKKIANETLEIFAPVAHRLGMYNIKSELEDLALYYLKRDVYEQIVEEVNQVALNLDRSLTIIKKEIKKLLDDKNIENEMTGRIKSIYSIYKKLATKNKRIEEIYDIVAIRIIVETVNECYVTLGVIHELYRPIPQRFKDYVSMPKPNMYQALHTTVIGPTGQPFEIQIKTHEMDKIAEQGIASHWSYKENSTVTSKQEQQEIEQKYDWFRNMMSFNEDDYNSEEYLEVIKHDIFNSSLYVFTPNGQTIHLPEGSTPIDFAYKIHTEVGHKMVGAKVNGGIVPIGTKLNTGDVVEILTNANSLGPSIDWLEIANTSSAKHRIRQFFKQSNREQLIETGGDKLKKIFRANQTSYNNFLKSKEVDAIIKSYKLSTLDELLSAVGYGSVKGDEIIEKYLLMLKNINEDDDEWILTKNYKTANGVIVPGVDNLPIDIANCCRPIPGDEIIGYISKTGVIRIHRADCVNITNSKNTERIINVLWADHITGYYEAYLQIQCNDRTSLLSDILRVFGASNCNVTELNTKTEYSMHIMKLTILVKDKEHFNRITENVKKVKGVLSVERLVK